MYVCMYICMYGCTYEFVYDFVYVCIHLCMYLRRCLYVCAYVRAKCMVSADSTPSYAFTTVDKHMQYEAEAEPHRYARYAKGASR